LNDLKTEISSAKLLKEKLDIPKEQLMDVKLGDALKVGNKFSYIYDFGTPTEIDLKVIDKRKGTGFRILARNLPIEFKCSVCGKKAKWVCPYCLFEGEDCYFCDECTKEHECYEDGLLPIVNSPRCGVCGYEGSLKYEDI